MVFPAQTTGLNDTIPNATSPTTTLQAIATLLKLSTSWVNEQDVMGKRVARWRRMYDGDHDMPLSKFQRELLQIKDSDDGMAVNLIKNVIDVPVNRTIVSSMDGIEDVAPDTTEQGSPSLLPTAQAPTAKKPVVNDITRWAQEVADNNDFDVIQSEAHENAYRDGNGYVLAEWDGEEKQVKFCVELAWDGQSGVLMVYKSKSINKPYCAIKVWQLDGLASENGKDTEVVTRMNVYYEDRVEKFSAPSQGGFVPYTDDDDAYKGKNGVFKWDSIDGKPIGIPVVHFRNGGRQNYGVSEMRSAVPIQNSLNRAHYSSVIAAELTAFAIYVEIGFSRDGTTVMPGMVVQIPDVKPSEADMKKLEGSDLSPILAMVESERRLIGEITSTPSPDMTGGGQQSGEYLKQLEIGLVAKVQRFTTRAGSSWEQVFDLAWRIQQAWGTKKPPMYKRFVCRWRDPEIRNSATVVTNAVALDPIWGNKETLRAVSGEYDLTEERIEQILSEKQASNDQRVSKILGGLPGYGGNTNPATTPALSGGAGAMMVGGNKQVAEMSRI